MRASIMITIAFSIQLLLGGDASASVARALDLAELVANSSDIIEGTVESLSYSAERSGAVVYTHVVVKITASHKGKSQAGDQLTLRLLGGRDGDQTLVAVGTPSFTPDEKVLLFLENHSVAGRYRPVGMAQGTFAIDSGKARRDLSGVTLLGEGGEKVQGMEEVGLSDLRAAIHNQVGE